MDSVLILNTNINVTSVEEVTNLLQKRDAKTIAVCNTNTLVRSYKNKKLQDKINAFSIRVPDGFPVAKASNILYKNKQKRVDGYNIFHKTIEKGLENRLEEIWGVECTLYYPDKYAGTADCVGVYEGQETIIDFKQSNKPKKSEYIDSWLLQTSAYSLAHNIVYNSNITSCVILVCTVDKLFQQFKIQSHDLVVYQNLFLGRLKKFNELSNLA